MIYAAPFAQYYWWILFLSFEELSDDEVAFKMVNENVSKVFCNVTSHFMF